MHQLVNKWNFDNIRLHSTNVKSVSFIFNHLLFQSFFLSTFPFPYTAAVRGSLLPACLAVLHVKPRNPSQIAVSLSPPSATRRTCWSSVSIRSSYPSVVVFLHAAIRLLRTSSSVSRCTATFCRTTWAWPAPPARSRRRSTARSAGLSERSWPLLFVMSWTVARCECEVTWMYRWHKKNGNFWKTQQKLKKSKKKKLLTEIESLQLAF